MTEAVVKSVGIKRSRRWPVLTAAAVYALFVVAPAVVVAAVRKGTERGDTRKDQLLFGQAYGPSVAAYISGAPRAGKVLELSALVVLPLVLFLLALPGGKMGIALRDVRRAAVMTVALVVGGHLLVYTSMLIGGGGSAIAGSWVWRLTTVTLLSCAAELGAIAIALKWFGSRPLVALLVVSLLALVGTGLRRFDACGVPVLPTCVDTTLLSGRPSQQLLGAAVALAWLTLAIVLVPRRTPSSA